MRRRQSERYYIIQMEICKANMAGDAALEVRLLHEQELERR